MKSRKTNGWLFIIILCLIGFVYRFYALNANYSFWSDENQTAIFARAILERGFPVLSNGYTPTIYLPFWYYLPAFSMKILGISEFAMRLPSVIFGVLAIWAIYLVGKELFNKEVGLIAALFTTFLKIEILWSRQARPYQVVQFFYLLAIYYFLRFLNDFDKNKRISNINGFLFLLISVFASLMHPFGLLLFVYFGLYLILVRRNIIKAIWQKSNKWFLILGGVFLSFILWKINFFVAIKNFIYGGWGTAFKIYNQTYYYRSFLRLQYSLIGFLSILGLIIALLKKIKIHLFFVILLIIHLSFISFRLSQPFVRYIYIIFPIFVLFFSYALWQIVSWFIRKEPLKIIILFLLVLFILVSGSKFTLVPKKIYSLNEDMQEIPEVDFKRAYTFIKDKLNQDEEIVYISNWNDHAVWYLGEGELDYLLRITERENNNDPLSGAFYIKDLDSLKKVILENDKGLILLESWESELPERAREHIRENLKKEFEIDRIYDEQPRYWPIEVYSWGIEKD